MEHEIVLLHQRLDGQDSEKKEKKDKKEENKYKMFLVGSTVKYPLRPNDCLDAAGNIITGTKMFIPAFQLIGSPSNGAGDDISAPVTTTIVAFVVLTILSPVGEKDLSCYKVLPTSYQL